MGPTRLVILIVAAVCSVGLGFLVLNMMGKKPAPVAPIATTEVTMQKVLVAKRDLKIGERVTADAVGWQPWPPGSVNASFITDGEARPMPSSVAAATDKVLEAVLPDSAAMTAIEGSIVREPIFASEPIVQRKLLRGGQGGYMSVVLQPGMRAVGVPVTVETGAGGFILPNDHVDLLLNEKIEAKTADGASRNVATSRVIMRNVRVLAIDQATEPEAEAKAMVGAVATLEIPAEDVPMVTSAKMQGELALTLRAFSDATGGPERGFAVSGSSDMVRVFRNGQSSDVRVSQ